MPPIFSDPFFLAGCCFLLFHLLLNGVVYRKLAFEKPECSTQDDKNNPVSVIIAAKDEAANLKENLPAILEQDYPDFEVIVANDQSEDATLDVLKEFSNQYSHLKIVNVEAHIKKRAGKKYALTMAIKKAANEVLVFTDADCKPGSVHWINYMQRHYQQESTKFVIGFSGYDTGSALDPLIQYDTYHTALHYFSLGKLGMPYMGVGRNLSYRKSLFMKNKGFAVHQHLPAGDDDLFVNHYANADNTAFEYCTESFTWSRPGKGLKDWWRQKKRHLNSGKHYRGLHRSILGGMWLLQFLFYLALILILIFNPSNYYAWGLLGVKIVLFYSFAIPGMQKLKIQKIMPFGILLDFIYQVVYLPLIGLIVALQKRQKHGW